MLDKLYETFLPIIYLFIIFSPVIIGLWYLNRNE